MEEDGKYNMRRKEVSPTTQQQRLISSFLASVAGQTSEVALRFLRETQWDLGEAIDLFYIQTRDGFPRSVASECSAAAVGESKREREDDDDDEEEISSHPRQAAIEVIDLEEDSLSLSEDHGNHLEGWHFFDSDGVARGPFRIRTLAYMWQKGYFESNVDDDIKVWRTYASEGVFLSQLLFQLNGAATSANLLHDGMERPFGSFSATFESLTDYDANSISVDGPPLTSCPLRKREEEISSHSRDVIDVDNTTWWHYLDPNGVTLGPSPIENLEYWWRKGYFQFYPEFKVWRCGSSPTEAIPLLDAFKDFLPFPKEDPIKHVPLSENRSRKTSRNQDTFYHLDEDIHIVQPRVKKVKI